MSQLRPGANEIPAAEPGTRAKSDSENVPGVDSHAVTLSPWVACTPSGHLLCRWSSARSRKKKKKTLGVDVPTVYLVDHHAFECGVPFE